MSLAARCPWCETVFRLTEGQVSAKGGMARCGVCNHTFNALDALLSDSAVAALERGAQAREANQEAAARANEQNATRPTEPGPVPLSIRKVFGGSSTPAPAPVASSAPPGLTSASLSALRASFLGQSPERSPGGATAPVTATGSHSQATAVAAPPTSPAAAPLAASTAAAATAPLGAASATPPGASQAAVAAEKPDAADPSRSAELQPGKEQPAPLSDLPAKADASSHAPQVDPASATVEPASTAEAPGETASSDAPRALAPLPIDYQVEMPNYDAERAAALAKAERAQKEQDELQQQGESHSASAAAQEIDQIQSALSPGATTAARDQVAAEQAPTTATLNSLRLHHAAVQAASAADLLREEERLGPNTFQPSFLQSSPPAGRFRRTRRVFGSLLALVLLVCLLAQATYWWRSDVAVRVPQAKPYLVRACQRLHCEVEPPAQIDQLSIESSELVAAPGTAGALSFTALVRNHSGNALAYPAIEITLTDARDQAILRRVFLPDSYLADPLGSKRLAGLPGNSEYTLKLTFNTSGVATSGYRAGIFYP